MKKAKKDKKDKTDKRKRTAIAGEAKAHLRTARKKVASADEVAANLQRVEARERSFAVAAAPVVSAAEMKIKLEY